MPFWSRWAFSCGILTDESTRQLRDDADPTYMSLRMNDESYSEPGAAESDFKQCLGDPNKPLFDALEPQGLGFRI